MSALADRLRALNDAIAKLDTAENRVVGKSAHDALADARAKLLHGRSAVVAKAFIAHDTDALDLLPATERQELGDAYALELIRAEQKRRR